MRLLRSRMTAIGALAFAAALVWGSGTVAAALPQSERLPIAVRPAGVVDYATNVVTPGSRLGNYRPTYDQ